MDKKALKFFWIVLIVTIVTIVITLLFLILGDSLEAQDRVDTSATSKLCSNEGCSRVVNRSTIYCSDQNKNRAWMTCRMKDVQSGDIVGCRDRVQADLFGCVKAGKSGRQYDWHQNGYVHRGEKVSQGHWNPRKKYM